MRLQYDAHVIVSVKSHEHHVVRRDEQRDDGEYNCADDAGFPYGTRLFEAYRGVHCHVPLDGEREDQTRGEVREEIKHVLQELTHEFAPVDNVDLAVVEIHAT